MIKKLYPCVYRWCVALTPVKGEPCKHHQADPLYLPLPASYPKEARVS